jgi:6-phosphofructokinase 1
MWIVREGYEGLVRGNKGNAAKIRSENDAQTVRDVEEEVKGNENSPPDQNLLHNLRFGDGDLLRDGTSEYVGGRTLKDRYIVRVGWDDVRGWFSEVRIFSKKILSSAPLTIVLVVRVVH